MSNDVEFIIEEGHTSFDGDVIAYQSIDFAEPFKYLAIYINTDFLHSISGMVITVL
jgi:hypothetical protein